MPTSIPIAERHAVRILLSGRVQGLGVRPAIARLARTLDLAGTVSNQKGGVEIVVEGTPAAIDQFRRQLESALPSAAVVEHRAETAIAPASRSDFRFEVHEPAGPLAVRMPVDRVVCADCLREVASAEGRRFGYALTSCALCGPRYSIIRALPFERHRTAMSVFPLCPECRREEGDPVDRRVHAQTTSCPVCGPRLWLRDSERKRIDEPSAALTAAVEALSRGQILALRGLGGYQLLADATSSAVVARLRQRKHRRGKPFALLIESLVEAQRLAFLTDADRRMLTDSSGPIVLVPSRTGTELVEEIAPGLNHIGLMLPTTPLHWQLAHRFGKPLVCTSGNREGEPLAVGVEQAENDLAQIADVWLHHDRPIVRTIDDSVVRVIAGRPVTIRCARGLAPLPLDLATSTPMLAVGGHQKVAVALSNGVQAVLGPHVGDLDSLASRRRFIDQVAQLTELYDFQPEWIVHDSHPDYFTTRWALEQSVPTIAVQHHHAHVAAGMLEQGWLDREVLGVAFDGTGYGPDGTIWGGECLLARADRFERIGHLRPFRFPGGEAAVREPWRVAASLIRDAVDLQAAVRLFPDHDVLRLLTIADRGRLSPETTSAGRLFDAVAAIVLNRECSEFEGQPAMLLEAACDPHAEGEYPVPIRIGKESGTVPDNTLTPMNPRLSTLNSLELDWRPMIGRLLADRYRGISPGVMAMRFHRGLARGIAAVCRRCDRLPIVLSGGCFQNRVLTERVVECLDGHSQPIGLPGRIPPNDGGLAAGQLAVALARLKLQRGER